MSPKLQVAEHAHRLMDQAEDLARRTYEDQDLPHLAKVVAKPAPPARRSVPATPSPNNDSVGGLRPSVLLGGGLVGLLVVGACLLFGGLLHALDTPSEPKTPVAVEAPAPRVPFTDAEVIDWMRTLAANATSTQMEGALAGKPQTIQVWATNVDHAKVAPEEYILDADGVADVRRRGQLTSTDHEGRPEIAWSGVSGPVCHALVQDIYQGTSTHGVAVSIDGKDRNVSCAGDGHTIVFSPHL